VKPSEITNLMSAIGSKIALQIMLSHKLIVCSFKLEPRVKLAGERRGMGGAIAKPSSVSLEPDNDTKVKSL